MSRQVGSRWADTEEDKAYKDLQRKEKDEKKRKKQADKARKAQDENLHAEAKSQEQHDVVQGFPSKRRRLSHGGTESAASHEIESNDQDKILSYPVQHWRPCRRLDEFERLNHIEEGSYGWVSRAKEKTTGQIVALKKLKMDGSDIGGFPVTGLREVQCLMEARHQHIIGLLEVVVGQQLQDVFLVMEFAEHDLKSLQEDMLEPFMPSEVKTLLLQLSSAVEYLHDHWILHRDLKTSNVLMNNRGEIKIADFGMARHYGDPAPKMTQLVVTLWYRAPELLLGAEQYNQKIDVWSVGCIFGELLTRTPLFQGKNEVDQLSKVFKLCGVPTEKNWPTFRRLPNAKGLRLPRDQREYGNAIRAKFPFVTTAGADLLSRLLTLDPDQRPTAKQALQHSYFQEDPPPKPKELFPTFPSKAGQEKRRRFASPSAPPRGEAPKISGDEADFQSMFGHQESEEVGAGFQLRLG